MRDLATLRERARRAKEKMDSFAYPWMNGAAEADIAYAEAAAELRAAEAPAVEVEDFEDVQRRTGQRFRVESRRETLLERLARVDAHSPSAKRLVDDILTVRATLAELDAEEAAG
jgi:hypothetical protein